jgi:PKD repeat protein/subtilisin family serine protease
MLLAASVFAQEQEIAGGRIFEESLPRAGQMYYVPGEFLVKFKPGVSEQTIEAMNSANGVSTIYISPYAGLRILSVPSGQTVTGMVETYLANDNVEYAEANYVAYAMQAPNDELYFHQWHLHDSSSGGINAESAWTVSTGSGAVVAILDTGIACEDYSETDSPDSYVSYQRAPDLAGTSFVAGYDFVNNDEHPNDDSICGHGTHIAGIIAQSTHNGLGTAAVAYDASLMPVKVLDRSGAGTYMDIAEGIIWAADNGAHVINMGFGGTEPSTALEDAIAYAYNNGVTLIAAAGNDGIGGACYPAAYDDYVIAVGATRLDGTPAYYSNYGLSLDLVAPGGDLNVDQNADGYGDGILQQAYHIDADKALSWGYGFMEGTSTAAAHVSGVAALLIANENAVSPEQVRQALESTAEDKGQEGWDIRYGWGMVDAYAALQWTSSESEQRLASEALEADFAAERTLGPKNTTIKFINQSTGNFTHVLWDFGDGTTSFDRNPSHTYAGERTYTVSLTVTGPNGSDTKSKNSYIKIFIPYQPTADFTREPISVNAPLTVQFTDTSTCPARLINHDNGSIIPTSIESASHGGISTWTWDFGDGTTSNERNPSHTYEKGGTYTISLRVDGPGGSDTETKDGYIQVTPSAPTADFTATPVSGNSPLFVQFTNASTGHVSSWFWDFGDGTTSNEQNPLHTYQNIGSYTVSLTVAGLVGSDTETKERYIQVTSSAPAADFTATPRSGGDPLLVQFTDTSTGSISSRLWNFGDGTTSSERNPVHTYQNTGSYTVSLTVAGLGGSDTRTKEGYIQVETATLPIVADFAATPRSGNGPLLVQFTDSSTGDISSRLWNFGDGTTSNEQNPVHTYQNAGSYTVSLTVTGTRGSDTETKKNYIQVGSSAPVASFTAAPTSGSSPLFVQFTDTSTGNVSSRLWNFGDGTTSTEQNPAHTYQNTGSYTVSLTIAGPGGTDTETRQAYIQVKSAAPAANFTATPTSGGGPLVVQFTGISTGNISSRLWNFGDGTTSGEQNPVHTYQNAGSYTVSLTVTGPNGSDTETKDNYIQVTSTVPVASFTAAPRSGNSPLTVQFTDTSAGSISSRLWNFGDGTTSNDQNPVHTYQNVGSYTVSLTIAGLNGMDTETRQSFVQVTSSASSAPVANFTVSQRSGNSPLIVQFTDTSTGNISSRLWNFGDGTTSTDQNPVHVYTFKDRRDFTVSLTVSGINGTDTETKTDYIQISSSTSSVRVNIGLSKQDIFRNWYIATARISVKQNDSEGAPVAGAIIEGTWGGDFDKAVSGVTDFSGKVDLSTDLVTRGDTITFTIDKVIMDGKEIEFTGTKSASIRI